jgi:DNA-binding beta-propeller fold protein YncE
MRNTNPAVVRLIGLAVAVAAVTPAFAHDGEHAKRVPPDALAITAAVRTGAGEHTYESIPNWCQIPGGKPVLGPTHGGVVEDKDGNIYFSMDGGPHAILVYKPDGTFVRGIGDEKLLKIHGMCINDEGGEQFIYAAHLGGKQALKLKLDGTVVWAIPYEKFKESGKYQEEKQFNPTAIAVAPDGSVFVADGYGQNWVHKFDKDQKYVSSFGGVGTEPGKFQTCHGLGVDKRGEKPLLLVCDRANRRLQHFDFDGKFVAVIAENLRLPCAPSFHGGDVAIAELEGRVTILDKDNKEVAHLGDNPDTKQRANYGVPPEQWKPGIFTAPHGVSFDHEGNVYVMDWNASGRVSKFKRVDGAEKKQAAAPAAGKTVASR